MGISKKVCTGLILSLSLFVGLCSAQNAAKDSITKKADTVKRPGSSFATAIFINQKSQPKGIAEEYKWLDGNYPDYKKLGQEIVFDKDNPYNLIHIKTTDGQKKDVYFDIVKFYGQY